MHIQEGCGAMSKLTPERIAALRAAADAATPGTWSTTHILGMGEMTDPVYGMVCDEGGDQIADAFDTMA